MRGGSNGGRSGGGHGNGGGGHHHSNGQNSGRRVNPRVQTFDSNGPDVRIRGTAYQINEKYVTLARDATSAGDRVLAESYLQHAEHYQRFINEMTEEFNQYNQQNPQHQSQPVQVDGNGAAVQHNGAAPVVTPQADGLNDLDQGFLVGPRHGNGQGNGHGNSHAAPQPVIDGNSATVQHTGASAAQHNGAGQHNVAAVQHNGVQSNGSGAQTNGSGEQPREEGGRHRRHYTPRRDETEAV